MAAYPASSPYHPFIHCGERWVSQTPPPSDCASNKLKSCLPACLKRALASELFFLTSRKPCPRGRDHQRRNAHHLTCYFRQSPHRWLNARAGKKGGGDSHSLTGGEGGGGGCYFPH